MTQEVNVTVKARLTPVVVGPDDVLLLEFLTPTESEIMEAAVDNIQGTLRRAGRANEVIAIPAWTINVKVVAPSRTPKPPRKVTNGNLRPAVAKRRTLA